MDLSFNLAPSYRDLKDPTSRQNFDDTVEQKCVIDLVIYYIYVCFNSIRNVFENHFSCVRPTYFPINCVFPQDLLESHSPQERESLNKTEKQKMMVLSIEL